MSYVASQSPALDHKSQVTQPGHALGQPLPGRYSGARPHERSAGLRERDEWSRFCLILLGEPHDFELGIVNRKKIRPSGLWTNLR